MLPFSLTDGRCSVPSEGFPAVRLAWMWTRVPRPCTRSHLLMDRFACPRSGRRCAAYQSSKAALWNPRGSCWSKSRLPLMCYAGLQRQDDGGVGAGRRSNRCSSLRAPFRWDWNSDTEPRSGRSPRRKASPTTGWCSSAARITATSSTSWRKSCFTCTKVSPNQKEVGACLNWICPQRAKARGNRSCFCRLSVATNSWCSLAESGSLVISFSGTGQLFPSCFYNRKMWSSIILCGYYFFFQV